MDSRFGTIKKGLKKIASRARLPSGRRGSQESQRNITPPRSTVPDDAFTTPPTAIGGEGVDDTPLDVIIATPGTPPIDAAKQQSKYRFPWPQKKTAQPPVPETTVSEPDMMELDVDAELLEPGITGADLSLPLFDGLSSNPADHLIDLETDSMERCADVRMYFWMIGWRVLSREKGDEQPDDDEPTDPSFRVEYDDMLVKTGREYLRQSQLKGDGRYLDIQRDGLDTYLASNHPDRPWYRFPCLGLVRQLEANLHEHAKEGDIMWGEGTFWDRDPGEQFILDVIKTNIRIPVVWSELLKKGVVQGTTGWNDSISARYSFADHPVCMLKCGGYSDLELLSSLLTGFTGPDGFFPCSYEFANHVIARDFPHIKEPLSNPEDRVEEGDLAKLNEHMSNMEDFWKGKKEFREKKTLFGVSFG